MDNPKNQIFVKNKKRIMPPKRIFYALRLVRKQVELRMLTKR